MKYIVYKIICFFALIALSDCTLLEPDIQPQFRIQNHTVYVTDFTITQSNKEILQIDSVYTSKGMDFRTISTGTVQVKAVLRGYSKVLTENINAEVNRQYTISLNIVFNEPSITIYDTSSKKL